MKTMIPRSNACDPRRLDRLLHNRLPEDQQHDVEAHLLVCPACRNRLDELAGGARWWAEVRRHLDGAADVSRTSDPDMARRSPEDSLDFLQPSDNPAVLGRLGSYEVLEVLGQGGMGVVLKAFDPALHRPVAIKVLAAPFASSGAARKRFAREAQADAAVSHDHVVPVHAVDAAATPPYLVMAFIPGQSLQDRIDRSGPLELKEILRVGMQTASGLAAAHAQGIIHRDIKPANIMLENGIERVRITDFGLARAVDDASVSQNGAVAGTPQYMAPEQARGEVVDQRADLFALGSTLYAMATGRAPFRGDCGLAVIRQVCDSEPVLVREINPDIPIWLEGIIRKLHVKDPSQRFQSAGEVAALLERCLAHVQQPNQHPLPPEADELGRQISGAKQPRLDRRWWPLMAVVTGSALAGMLLFFPARPTGERETTATERPRDRSSVRPVPEEIGGARFDERFQAGADQMRAQLKQLQQSFSPASASAGDDLEQVVRQLRRQVVEVQRHLDADVESDNDPWEVQLESIRRRLERLRQEIRGYSP
jgi:serine/threonine-protein kinase